VFEAVIAFIVANLLDILSTNYAIKLGGSEANPIVQWMMGKLGNWWFLGKLSVASVALAIFVSSDLVWGVWAAALFYFAVSLKNFRIARKIEDK